MRLILEKAEIVKIVGKHFDADLDPDSVVIRTDPLEIEVSGIPLPEREPAPENVTHLPKPRREATPPRTRDDKNATIESPPPGVDEIETDEEATAEALALVEQSRQLEKELTDKPRRATGFDEMPTYSNDEV